MTLRTIFIATITALALAAPAAADVPENADWTEAYIETPGEPTLHADILKPKGTPEGAKLPVILSIGPYHGHGGQTTPNGDNTDRPSTRWKDLIEDGQIFEHGYALVMADLRGFGASQGCNDFGGSGEQMDVKRAVEWAAAQPWSTGKVALYGKSYDGWTGVMGLDEKPQGLAAAVILAPIIDGYRTLYQNGVHYDSGWYGTPGLYQAIDAIPPAPADDPEYFASWAQGLNPACYVQNIANQSTNLDWDSPFWEERNLPGARGSDVPVIWSHGFLDANTKPDNFLPVWETLKGPKLGWFGQYDHKRPNETSVGREGFFAEMWPFLDRYVKGDASQEAALAKIAPTTIQEGDGRWRAEAVWPPADAKPYAMEIKGGTVMDLPNNDAEGKTSGETGVGAWSFGPPVPHETRLAGVPKVKLDVSAPGPRAHVYTLLYDVGPSESDDGLIGTLISRAAHVVTGEETLEFELYPQDWTLEPGHRLGLLVAGSDLDWYNPPHSGQPVEIAGGTLTLPFLSYIRDQFLEGDISAAMNDREPIEIDPADLEERSVPAQLPPALVRRPKGTKQGEARGPKGGRLGLKVALKRLSGRRLRVVVRRAGTAKVRLTLLRNGKRVGRRSVAARRGKAKAIFRLRRGGTYRVTARLVDSRVRTKGRSRTIRIR